MPLTWRTKWIRKNSTHLWCSILQHIHKPAFWFNNASPPGIACRSGSSNHFCIMNLASGVRAIQSEFSAIIQQRHAISQTFGISDREVTNLHASAGYGVADVDCNVIPFSSLSWASQQSLLYELNNWVCPKRGYLSINLSINGYNTYNGGLPQSMDIRYTTIYPLSYEPC